MSKKAPSPGGIIDARCTRCRTVTNHTIVAMVEKQVARVQCNTCGGVHNYHPEKPAKAPAAPRASSKGAPAPRKSPKDPAAGDRAAYEELLPTLDPGKAIAYTMQVKYKEGDQVGHPVFGLGIVTRRVSANSVEILFREGKKLLRCG